MEFDLIGLDAPIANALRRILISEVPSMAIETVYMDANTSILFDEFLSHRFGLIPILADPREFDFSETDVGITDLTTIVFRIDITCTKKAGALGDELEPSERYNNSSVYSSDLIWTPAGNQKDRYIDNPPKVAYDDILIAKLRPGQRIAATLHCSKGIGKEHAKWSPVGTATYRLLPDIRILKPITGADAIKFQKCFLEGTIEVVDIKGVKTARVLNPRKDTASREALRHPEFKDKVLLTRIRDHFICNLLANSSQYRIYWMSSSRYTLRRSCKYTRSKVY